jgi:ribosomal protein S18 acetylase RimI-like enzyme
MELTAHGFRRPAVDCMTDNTSPNPTRRDIRPFHDADETEVVGVWHRSGLAAYTYLPTWQALTLETAQFVFHNIIRAKCAIWVGTLNEQIVAYLAMHGSYIDRLYVDPSEWRKSWGTRFINLAKQLSPHGLELHTHQENNAARELYERHGFTAVKFGISPPPESAPDVEYHWRP